MGLLWGHGATYPSRGIKRECWYLFNSQAELSKIPKHFDLHAALNMITFSKEVKSPRNAVPHLPRSLAYSRFFISKPQFHPIRHAQSNGGRYINHPVTLLTPTGKFLYSQILHHFHNLTVHPPFFLKRNDKWKADPSSLCKMNDWNLNITWAMKKKTVVYGT